MNEKISKKIDQITHDLNEMKLLMNEAPADYQESLNELHAIAASASLYSSIEDSQIMKSLLNCAMAVVSGEGTGLTLFDEESESLIFRCAVGLGSEGIIGQKVPPSGSVHGLAFATGEVQSSTPIYNDIESSAKAVFKNVLVAPLTWQEETIGTISAVNKIDVDFFTPEDMIAFRSFSDVVAAILWQQSQLDQVKKVFSNNTEAPSIALDSVSRSLYQVLPGILEVLKLEGGEDLCRSFTETILRKR